MVPGEVGAAAVVADVFGTSWQSVSAAVRMAVDWDSIIGK
jgi:hypothetical protein